MFYQSIGFSFNFVFCIFDIDIIIVILVCQFDYIWNELKRAPGQPVRNFPDWIIRSRKTAAAQTKGHGRNFVFACLPLYLQASSSTLLLLRYLAGIRTSYSVDARCLSIQFDDVLL